MIAIVLRRREKIRSVSRTATCPTTAAPANSKSGGAHAGNVNVCETRKTRERDERARRAGNGKKEKRTRGEKKNRRTHESAQRVTNARRV